jgi:glyoxylate reductase
VGTGVTGKVLAMVGGAGRIARQVARRARGFDMKIIYWSPTPLSKAEERDLGMTYVPFDQLFTDGDFVSVHSPLKPQTYHQIGEREFSLMKPSAYLINTARGPIVDEKALVRALQEKRIAGAGLDVFEFEPHVSPELLKMDNVVVNPHLGSAVYELRDEMANLVTDNVIAVLEGRIPPNCVNPEIYSK